MRPITSTRSPSASARPVSERPHDGAAQVAAPATSRSLVVVGAPTQRPQASTRCPRPSAPFLAHLIASAQQAPQTRARRQAEPAEAAVHYAAAEPTRAGQVLRSTM